MCLCVPVCGYVHMSAGTLEGWRQQIPWHWSSGWLLAPRHGCRGAVCAFSPAPHCLFNLFSFWDKVSYRRSWSCILCVVEGDLELLTLLPYLDSIRIACGHCNTWFLCGAGAFVHALFSWATFPIPGSFHIISVSPVSVITLPQSSLPSNCFFFLL